jgi:hypothetical protein
MSTSTIPVAVPAPRHPGWCSPAHCCAWTSRSGAVTVDHAARPESWRGTGAEVSAQLAAGDELAFPGEAPVPYLALSVASTVFEGEAAARVFLDLAEMRGLIEMLARQLAAAECHAADPVAVAVV